MQALRSRGRPWHALFKGCTKSRRFRRRALAELGRSPWARQEAAMRKAFAAAKALASLMGQALYAVVLLRISRG